MSDFLKTTINWNYLLYVNSMKHILIVILFTRRKCLIYVTISMKVREGITQYVLFIKICM